MIDVDTIAHKMLRERQALDCLSGILITCNILKLERLNVFPTTTKKGIVKDINV